MTRTPAEIRDLRPTNCRFRLQDEGKPYPRSRCTACGKGISTGLGSHCQSAPPAPAAMPGVETAARAWCVAAGLDPDFFWDGKRNWQKVTLEDATIHELKVALQEEDQGATELAQENERLMAAHEDAAREAFILHMGERNLREAAEARALSAEQEAKALRKELLDSVADELWSAYNIGIERDGKWMDAARSEGEWLAREAGLSNGWHDAGALKEAIPAIAEKVVAARIAAAIRTGER